jgi:hypothetical protein
MTDQKMLQDILDIVRFTQDNMATKLDLKRFVTKADYQFGLQQLSREITETKAKIDQLNVTFTTHLDGFVGLHKKLDVELVALRAKYDRLESYIEQLAKHTKLQLEG